MGQPQAADSHTLVESVIIRFAGDSGDGIQTTGGLFTQDSAVTGHDISTLPPLVHDEASRNVGFTYGLANLDYPDFPLPVGVLRAAAQPTYEDLVEQQIEVACQTQGFGDLEALLDAGECWTVE